MGNIKNQSFYYNAINADNMITKAKELQMSKFLDIIEAESAAGNYSAMAWALAAFMAEYANIARVEANNHLTGDADAYGNIFKGFLPKCMDYMNSADPTAALNEINDKDKIEAKSEIEIMAQAKTKATAAFEASNKAQAEGNFLDSIQNGLVAVNAVAANLVAEAKFMTLIARNFAILSDESDDLSRASDAIRDSRRSMFLAQYALQSLDVADDNTNIVTNVVIGGAIGTMGEAKNYYDAAIKGDESAREENLSKVMAFASVSSSFSQTTMDIAKNPSDDKYNLSNITTNDASKIADQAAKAFSNINDYADIQVRTFIDVANWIGANLLKNSIAEGNLDYIRGWSWVVNLALNKAGISF